MNGVIVTKRTSDDASPWEPSPFMKALAAAPREDIPNTYGTWCVSGYLDGTKLICDYLLPIDCSRCHKHHSYSGKSKGAVVAKMQRKGWDLDDSLGYRHLCPVCVEQLTFGGKLALDLAPRSRPDACEICLRKRTVICDCNHLWGPFRGWICLNCYHALSDANNSADRLRKLADYLERNKK